jgi:membrane protein
LGKQIPSGRKIHDVPACKTEMVKKEFHNIYLTLKKSLGLFNRYNGLKLSAALSFYTIFSLVPFLIIVISLAGIFLGRKEVELKVYGQISGLIGSQGAMEVQEVIRHVQHTEHGMIGGIIGFVILFFGAAAVFSEIQESISLMWILDRHRQQGLVMIIIKKLLSFSLIIGMSFILVISLITNAAVDFLIDHLKTEFPGRSVYLFYLLNFVVILIILTCLFAIIFRVLPNVMISWKDLFVGSVFTALLFILGKFLIGFYIGNSHIGSLYGATASILVIMLWVYYSSIILYFGVAFMKIYITGSGRYIQAK